ncbi:hypothetical protein LCGC14_2338560, partial [marine sediment metagenome]
LSMFLISSVPNVLAGGKGKGKGKGKPEKPSDDIFAEFVLQYNVPDADFNTIDFSGISYLVDNVEFFTDASGIINLVFNDILSHNFTILFGGVSQTIIITETITSQDVMLSTKTIDLSTVFDEIFIIAGGIDVEIWYNYAGTSWDLIQVSTTNVDGDASILGLVKGTFVISEVGLFNSLNNFTLDQPTTLYTTQLIIQPIKTVFDLDYVTSIFGADYPVNISGLVWDITSDGTSAFSSSTWSDGFIINGGIVSVYNLFPSMVIPWIFTVFNYGGISYVSDVVIGGFNEVELPSKVLEATWLYSYDNAPAVGFDVILSLFNGTDFEEIGSYTTDLNGKITVSNLPIGQYKLNGDEFDIIATDLIHTESYILESKSLEATFAWNSDDSAVVGLDFELFNYNTGTWILVGVFTTDLNGLINLTSMLQAGTYKFDDYSTFEILESDTVKVIQISVESILDGLKGFFTYIQREPEYSFLFFNL